MSDARDLFCAGPPQDERVASARKVATPFAAPKHRDTGRNSRCLGNDVEFPMVAAKREAQSEFAAGRDVPVCKSTALRGLPLACYVVSDPGLLRHRLRQEGRLYRCRKVATRGCRLWLRFNRAQ